MKYKENKGSPFLKSPENVLAKCVTHIRAC